MCVLALGLAVGGASAQDMVVLPPVQLKVAVPAVSREEAVRWALENNPEIATIRQQRGIAAGAVVVARTYPFNPVLSSRAEAASGPADAGITNRVLNQHKLMLELELRGQRGFRQQAANAALSRTDWDIAYREVLLAARVLRAFDGVLYRNEKLRLADERILLNESAATLIDQLRKAQKVSAADPILILTEIDNARAARGAAEVALTTAQFELRRATGAVEEVFTLSGGLQNLLPKTDREALVALGLQRRPDLQARHAAVAEAEARLRLENSNRYGNCTIGPGYELDATNTLTVGVSMNIPIPVFNRHRGEILQRQAEQTRAMLEVRQVEVLVQQDVQAALARLQKAQAWVESYEQQVLPNLRKSLDAVEKLFADGVAGVDVIRVLEIRRNLIRGQDAYLDALWERSQAQADLVAAVGDVGLVLGPEAVPGLMPCR
jgi:cobalt-zinc-cadmium efflux system outer membrane protein